MTRYILVGLMILSCFSIKAQTRTGDNLGTHKAEKDLNMNDKKIVAVSGMVIGNATMINNTSVALELAGTDKAFLFNRVGSLSAIVAPVDGMAVYNNQDNKFYVRQNGVWETLAAIGDLLWSKIVGKPTFAAVALSGDYNDLLNKPSIPTLVSQLTNDVGFITTTSLTWSNITGKPSFHIVATSGDYNDLLNKPNIPTALSQLTNDPGFITNAALTWSNISGKPSFHAVATTGNYNDLTNRPSIPTALSQLSNDANFITLSSLTWNNISGKPNFHGVATSGNYNTLNNKPFIPTAVSDLSNDLGFITNTSLTWSNITGKPSFHAVATSGNYNDLNNRPSIPTALSQLTNDPGYITGASLTWNNISGKPSFHVVATSGNYNDLSNRPSIPTALSQLTNDPGYITGASLTWNNISGKPSFHTVATTGNYNDLINRPTIPTLLSQLSNDVGYNKWYDGWVNYPGYDANTIGGSKSGFSYANNAPYSGPLAHFDAGGYGLQLSASYSGGNNIGFRTRNGDAGSWNGWREFIHSGNISSQSVNYANSAGSVSWSNVSGRPGSLSQFTNDLGNYGGWITTNGRAYPRRSDGADMNFYWSGQSGQPTWLWGSNDGINHYVWNPSNFSVNYANSAKTANSATNATNATNATYGRYIYDNGAYSGAAAWREASSMHVYYSYLGRLVYNNGAYSGSGWVEASDLGVRYANSAGSVPWSGISGRPSNLTLWDSWYGSAYLGSNGDLYMGWAGAWTSSWFNQSVRSDASPTFSTIYTSNWLRTYGATGWYNQDYGGGIYMTDATYVRTYGSKHFFVDQNIYAAGSVNAGGDIIGFTSTPSDVRLKKNMKRITGASDIVRKLNGYYFDWKSTGKHDIGLKAQDVEKVLPEVVKETKLLFHSPLGEKDETKYKVVEYEKIIAVLIEAQKEQMDLVDELRKKNEENGKVIESLLKRVNDLEKNMKPQQVRKTISVSKK